MGNRKRKKKNHSQAKPAPRNKQSPWLKFVLPILKKYIFLAFIISNLIVNYGKQIVFLINIFIKAGELGI